MSKRMVIERYFPPVERPNDGLSAMPELPPPDGTILGTFVGRRHKWSAWAAETVQTFARTYARTCCAALDLEIDALKVERDALKAELDELRGRSAA
jgi:hypothetical protein